MNKKEKAAKEALRKKDLMGIDHVPVVTKKGGGLQYNEGQAVRQKTGSGLRDIAAYLRRGR